MIINLYPQRRDDSLTVSKQGDVLTINGTAYDFSVIPDGATLPASAISCEFIVHDVSRVSGELHLALLMPHGAEASEAARFPQPIVNPPDGNLEFPQ